MMGQPQRRQAKLFYTGINLEDRIPVDHSLRRIQAVLRWDWVRAAVAGCYGRNGHESLDPVVILKLMLLLFLENVRSERELMRQLPVRLDWLWFCEMDLDDEAPNHSVLSKARLRWGLDLFESLFARVLHQCREAGLIDGSTLHVDSTVLTANASLESRVARQLWEQLERGLETEPEVDEAPEDQAAAALPPVPPEAEPQAEDAPPVLAGVGMERPQSPASRALPPQDTQADELPPVPTGAFNASTVSPTDPDAATTKRRGRGVTLGYRDHRLVDDRHGIVVTTIATAGDYDDATLLPALLDRSLQDLHQTPRRVVGDSAYGTRANQDHLRQRQVLPYLKSRASKSDRRPWYERLSPACDPWTARRLMGRRLSVAEGSFAEAHVRHGHRRCRWRRRWRVQIQCYLVAIAQNLRKLARYGGGGPRAEGAAQLFLTVIASMAAVGAAPLFLTVIARRWLSRIASPPYAAQPRVPSLTQPI